MLEEREDQIGVERFDDEVRWRAMKPLAGELEQQLECVRVAGTGVGARAALARETLLEERRDVRGERGHGVPPSKVGAQTSARSRMS